MNWRKLGGCLLLCSGAMACPEKLLALGFRIPNQDAEAIARGNAFVATADNPSALYYNPAGITQLDGQHLQFGLLSYLGISSRYRSPGGSRSETLQEIQPVPQLYYTYKPKDSDFAFGLGLYSPFGLGLQWPENTGFRTLAIEGRMQYLTANPIVAWQIHPTLSLALGPTFNYSKVKLRQGIGFLAGDQFEFKGDDFDFGFTAGLRWQPCEQWAFGVSFRSPTTMNYHGTAEQSPYSPTTKSSAKVDFAQTLAFGVSWRPTPAWNLEVNVDWADWGSLDTVVFKNTASGDIPFPLNWHSSFFYEAGATRYFANGWFASAGYFFSSNSTSERNFNPIVPDTDLHTGSLGVGHKGGRWQWAVAGQIITGPWRSVNNSVSTSLVGESANGKYRFFIPAITVSLGCHF